MCDFSEILQGICPPTALQSAAMVLALLFGAASWWLSAIPVPRARPLRPARWWLAGAGFALCAVLAAWAVLP